MQHDQLTATSDIEGNITIVLPARMLKHFVEMQGAAVSDLPKFASDLAHALIHDEQEDGTNHIHLAFDSAFDRFAEGHLDSEGLEFDDA